MLNNQYWYTAKGNNSDTVLSTRIRFARNLKGYPFPQVLDTAQKKQLCEEVKNALFASSAFADFQYIEMEQLNDVEAVSLLERHLISFEFAGNRAGKALILSPDESVSIMLCEEDHIRIQVIKSGLDFEQTYAAADNIDNLLDESLAYAFDERLGYLTACPTNLGTGMRASVMLHLPSLQESGAMQRISAGLAKIGLTIRGFYGESSEPEGCIYQLSNQVTLGLSEKSAIDNLRNISVQIIEQEREARAGYIKNELIEDKIWRSYAMLKYARLLSNTEFMKYLSNVRLGAASGILPNLQPEQLSELMIKNQPAMLISASKRNISPRECDILRAAEVRKAFAIEN
ncbi:MAG: protein arginine kinase [Oscillospiraceae bacterium]|jgi:protein arginine kinase|nr:protein arginine kinase [Oscillospiraceae bacterium]